MIAFTGDESEFETVEVKVKKQRIPHQVREQAKRMAVAERKAKGVWSPAEETRGSAGLRHSLENVNGGSQ